MNIAWINKLQLNLHLTNTEPSANEQINNNKFNDISYKENKFNLLTVNL
jgi:hypothetical protein